MKWIRTTAQTLVASVPLWLIGCGEATGSGGGWKGEVRDSAGIELVMNAGPGIWKEGEGWTVEQDLLIGTAVGAEEYQFGLIAGLDVGSDGRIYVLDQQAREVRVFSPDGVFLARMGNAGAGPGELSQGAAGLFLGAGDTVTVADIMNQRLTRYTDAGEAAGTRALLMSDGIPTRWVKAPGGGMIQQSMIMALPNQPDVEPKNLLLRRDAGGEIQDTLLVLPIGETMDFSRGMPVITFFESEPMWTVDQHGGIIWGNNSEYRLNVRRPGGELVRIISKGDGTRQPLTEGDRSEFRRALANAWSQAQIPPEVQSMMLDGLRFTPTYPAYMNLLAGPRGTLWVQHVQTPETVKQLGGTFDVQDLGAPTWDVFDADGLYLGIVTLPLRFTPMLFDGNRIYGMQRDEFDVQYIARLVVMEG